MLLDSIIYHRQDVKDIEKEDAFTETMNGMKQRKFTTADWKFCIQWKDWSADWVAHKDINQLYTFELADCAKRMKIDNDPEFSWWDPYVERRRQIKLSKVKSNYWQQTHEYGIQLPKSVNKSYAFDEENKSNLREKVI